MRPTTPQSVKVFPSKPQKYITITSKINNSTNRSDDQKPEKLHHYERPAR
jgi:hypothetical protein